MRNEIPKIIFLALLIAFPLVADNDDPYRTPQPIDGSVEPFPEYYDYEVKRLYALHSQLFENLYNSWDPHRYIPHKYLPSWTSAWILTSAAFLHFGFPIPAIAAVAVPVLQIPYWFRLLRLSFVADSISALFPKDPRPDMIRHTKFQRENSQFNFDCESWTRGFVKD